MSVAGIKPESLGTGHLGFAIGPRLNAAGRLGTAKTAYDLLGAASLAQAMPLATQLEEMNLERQKLLESALQGVRPNAAGQAQAGRLIFVASSGFLPGIVGLIAGRLAEEFFRPAIAVEQGSEVSRGSCRSIPGFNMARALDECSDILERHGGHAQAAGFTVRTEWLPDLQRRLTEIAQREIGEPDLAPVIGVDSMIPLSQVNWDTLRWLEKIEPFGLGNPAPVFQCNGVRVREVRQVGNGHLRLSVSDGRGAWEAIAFRQGALAEGIRVGDRLDIVFNLGRRMFHGEESLQIDVKDLRATE
jgi:single-stranded-DNA-specific exonuclease